MLHAATLHKPHVGTHSRAAFVEVNVVGTRVVVDAALAAGVRSLVFTSSTSAFGRALTPRSGEPAAWIDETVPHRVRNVYGATKTAAEDLVELAAGEGLPAIVLRVARFFPEADDRDDIRASWDDANLKAVEFLHRRVDLADVVDAHLLAAGHAPALGFARYVVSAPTALRREDAADLGRDAAAVVRGLHEDLADRFAERGWRLPATLDRVYDASAARRDLGWSPRWDFRAVAELALRDGDPRSPLARAIGVRGYHDRPTGVYTS